jgi:hypothetical protein
MKTKLMENREVLRLCSLSTMRPVLLRSKSSTARMYQRRDLIESILCPMRVLRAIAFSKNVEWKTVDGKLCFG